VGMCLRLKKSWGYFLAGNVPEKKGGKGGGSFRKVRRSPGGLFFLSLRKRKKEPERKLAKKGQKGRDVRPGPLKIKTMGSMQSVAGGRRINEELAPENNVQGKKKVKGGQNPFERGRTERQD